MRAARIVATLGATLLMAGNTLAQVHTGNLFGRVVDVQQKRVPGVTVTLSGIGAPQLFVTDREGDFRFLALAPGRYELKTELEGFATVRRAADVSVAANSELIITIPPAVEETLTITAETPLLDVRKAVAGTNVDKVELEHVPSARDPWVILQTVPGVLVDRVNVGGSESGQQSYFVGKGTYQEQTAWNMDGVNITDMIATGATGMYYDFGTFDEIQVTIGSSDPRVQTAGVQLNMVTKRGTNDLRGSGRWFLTDHRFQQNGSIPAEARAYLARANEIDHIRESGFEAGGPLWRDRLWLWGAYGKQQINNVVVQTITKGVPDFLATDNTTLENYTAKLNAQLSRNNSAAVFYSHSDKIKLGRGVGAKNPPETGFNQSGPGHIWKVEDTHIFSPSFYLTAVSNRFPSGFKLDPAGGVAIDAWLDEQRVLHRSNRFYETFRWQEASRFDASQFFDTAHVGHELKFGFGYRSTPVQSFSTWPGSGNWGEFFSDGTAYAHLTRPADIRYGSTYMDGYVGDTALLGNFTIQAGLRYDRQTARNRVSKTSANPLVPDLLPASSFNGDQRAMKWTSVSPRVAVTCALGESRRTLLRAAYNRYADQLGAYNVGAANPFFYIQGIVYYWEDINGDKIVQRPEIRFDLGRQGFYYLDPNNPAAPLSPGRIDYRMDPPRTDEVVLGLEQELAAAFTVGIDYTYRRKSNFTWTIFEKNQGEGNYYTKDDYVLARDAAGNQLFATGMLPEGTPYSVPYYRLKPGLPAPVFFVTTTRPDYRQTYQGIDVVFTRRLSNRWMMRGNVSVHDWRQHVGDNGYIDPTPIAGRSGCVNCNDAIVADENGKGTIFVNSRWSYSFNGVYQLPRKFSLGASVQGREGYPLLYHHRLNPGDGTGFKRVLLAPIGRARLNDVFDLDVRLAKEIAVHGRTALILSADLFNATNQRTVLQRDIRLFNSRLARNPAANQILELQSPRVWRFAARVAF